MAFCFKLILLLIILWGIDRLVGESFVKIKNLGLQQNPESMWLKTPFTVEKVHADVLVIGSSKASHHYVPKILENFLGMSVYNCGQDGCFFLYQNCIINMLLDRYTPKIILWDIQPESFIGSDNEYQNIRYLSPYYYTNKWAASYINSESKKMPYKMLSRMFAYNSKILNYVYPVFTFGSTTDQGYVPLPNEGYKYPEYYFENERGGQINEDYLNLLASTIKRCKLKGIKLNLYISPEFSKKSVLTTIAENQIGHVAAMEKCNFLIIIQKKLL